MARRQGIWNAIGARGRGPRRLPPWHGRCSVVALVTVVGAIATAPIGVAWGLSPAVASSFLVLALLAAVVAWRAPVTAEALAEVVERAASRAPVQRMRALA